MPMFYVPDGTNICGFYECKKCNNRFLDLKIVPALRCISCDKQVDMEIGPDEKMPVLKENAKLVQMLTDEEEIEKYDKLLSLAVTGGDYNWI